MLRCLHINIGLLISLLLASCTTDSTPIKPPISPIPTAVYLPTPQPTPTQTPTPTFTAAPTSTPTQTPSHTSFYTPTPSARICTPLQEISIKELPEIVTNPFQMPLPGKDDAHHGVDLAFYRRGSRIGILGLQIQSVFNGSTAAVITNQQPYGNMVIIETKLNYLPGRWINSLALPQIRPTVPPAQGMTCPTNPYLTSLNISNRSLYLLYAHMNQPSSLKMGESVECGQTIGEVGTTGWSVNPHLHLEARLGPSGARFEKMTHYIGNASDMEMANYCAWRISGLFQPINPMQILAIAP